MTNDEAMAAWVVLLESQKCAALFDFGWYLEHVSEPRDKRGTR